MFVTAGLNLVLKNISIPARDPNTAFPFGKKRERAVGDEFGLFGSKPLGHSQRFV